MVHTLENFAPVELVDKLEELIGSHEFPWFWRPSTVHGMNDGNQASQDFQFVHLVYFKDAAWSPIYSQVRELLLCIEQATGIFIKDINKIKANLMTREYQSEEILNEAIHIDVNAGPTKFMSFVYYVVDSDGDTVVYDDDGKVVTAKAPVKGTLVYFPSEMRHRATPPKDHKRRIVLNIIVEIE